MREFTESRLVFRFDDEWAVEQWDAQPAYRAAGAFGSLPGTAACDFIGWHTSDRFFFFEVKNFTDHHHDNVERVRGGELALEAASKVRDTMAGMVWARGRDFDRAPLTALLDKGLDALVGDGSSRVRVVLWVEDRPALSPIAASALATDLKRHLKRWFKIQRVLVTSIALFDRTTVPGLSVREAP